MDFVQTRNDFSPRSFTILKNHIEVQATHAE